MKIIVIRHASTNYNAKHLINGQHDDSLSPEGLKELPGLVKKLKAYDFTVIYSSPLKRAVQTAMAIAEDRNIEIVIDRRLMEVNFGSFTSENWDSLKTAFGMDSGELLNTYKYDLTGYGGESYKEVKKRVQSFLDDLYKDPDQTPIIVTHGGILRWLYLLLGNKKITGQPNSSIHVFDVKT